MSLSSRLLAALRLALGLLDAHGLSAWSFEFNYRRAELGRCRYGAKVIELSVHLVELNGEDLVRETLLHEIAHALAGPGHGHDDVWKRKCVEIGAEPERLCDEAVMPPGRWRAACRGCGRAYSRHRRPKHLTGWFCRRCGKEKGKLVWGKAGEAWTREASPG